MAKATNRFKVVSSSEVVVLESNKSAVKVELQYGKDSQPPELVIAELYDKDGEWAYTRSQVRVPATKELAKYLIDGINSAYKESLKVKKDVKASEEVVISKLSDAEKASLLEALLKEAKGFESILTKSKKVTK